MGSQNNIICSTDLTLGFGYSSSPSSPYNHLTNYISKPKTTPAAASKLLSVIFEPPSLNLTLSASSYQSNAAAKREREMMSINVKAEEGERVIGSRVLIISDEEEYEDNNGVNVRKKHRLSKSQSALLEQSFRHHTTLNPVQKQRLARELNLRPRQVEVWFQNRRARTKLKQIEAEYEMLKKCCETLTDENKRLRKEVQELKALKLMKPTSFYMQLPPPPPPPPPALNKCPSCGGGGSGGCKTTTKRSSFTMGPTTTHFYNPVNSPSAA